MRNRDEFSETTKRNLANRVAWGCSFPGCGKPTIGPDLQNPNKTVILGEAAHIYAAAPKGPRSSETLDSTQRRDISNGIWMCRPHAKLIDSDTIEYSVDTLQVWKKDAERRAYEALKIQENYKPEDGTTLISLGFDIIFYGRWLTLHGLIWTFEVLEFVKGDFKDLKDFSSNFGVMDSTNKFIIIESQGDARTLNQPIKYTLDKNLKHILEVLVDEKFLASDPEHLGTDLALNEDNDLYLCNGDIATVSGIKSGIQRLAITLSTIKGEYILHPNFGSLISSYYNEYKNDLELLARLIKLEAIRLALVKVTAYGQEKLQPPLHFIDRIEKIDLFSPILSNSRLKIKIYLILGNGTPWSGELLVFIREKLNADSIAEFNMSHLKI